MKVILLIPSKVQNAKKIILEIMIRLGRFLAEKSQSMKVLPEMALQLCSYHLMKILMPKRAPKNAGEEVQYHLERHSDVARVKVEIDLYLKMEWKTYIHEGWGSW